MKDSEFIELLNLYLDHEISAEDAARIETEVQQNPARRQLYRQYCSLQKACTLLAKDFVDQAAATGSPADKRISGFEARRSWGVGIYVGGLAAAAACVALLLVNRSPTQAGATASRPDTTAAQITAPVSTAGQLASVENAATPAIAHVVTVSAKRTELQPAFSTRALFLGNGERSADGALAADGAAVVRAQYNWMKSIELSPVQRLSAEDLRFDSKASSKANPQIYGPGRMQNDVQQAAFQFQR